MSSTELAIPQNVMERLAAQAKEAAAKERPALGRISLKSGVMSYSGSPIQGNAMEAIIVAAGHRSVYYEGRYDPNNLVSPNCFSFSLTGEDMVPDANVEKPAHPTCKGCPKAEWGSAGGNSRGKACKETRRLILMPATALETPEKVAQAELAILDLPVTSVRNYGALVNTLAASVGVPPHAAVVKVSVAPDAKTQFKVNFQPLRVVPTVELLDAIEKRIEAAQAIAIQPYEESAGGDEGPGDETPAPKPTGKKAKF